MDKKSTTHKGDEYAEAFRLYMLQHLGYNRAATKKGVHSFVNFKGMEADIIAEKISNGGIQLKKAAVKVSIGSATIAALGVIATFLHMDNLSGYLVCFGLSSLLTTILLIYLVDKYAKEHAWVECKNREKKVTIEEMQVLTLRVENYRKSKDKRFYFTEKYFVSNSGYAINAREHAEEIGIFCYMGESHNFVVAESHWKTLKDLQNHGKNVD